MNWVETRQRLIECGIAADSLPEEWEPGIDLTGADLTRANLSWADLYEANLYEASPATRPTQQQARRLRSDQR